jgi:hypothetical protein
MQVLQQLLTTLLKRPKREKRARRAPRGQQYLHQNLGVMKLRNTIQAKINPVTRLIAKSGCA